MQNKVNELFSNYLNDQKHLLDKYSRLFTSVKTEQYNNNKTALNLKKRTINPDYNYNNGKEKIGCNYCGKMYISKLPLQTHIQKMHSLENSRVEQSTRDYDDKDFSEDEEDLRRKLMKNVQAIERREEEEEVVISGIDSD